MTSPIRIYVLLLAVVTCLALPASAGDSPQSLNERLGYAATDKLLIVHADDAGVAHGVNTATFEALESGQVTSASVMANCPWLLEVAEYVKKNPQADIGVHLVLSAEWQTCKWGPVASKSEVPSLIDPLGYFYTIRDALAHIDPVEAEIEMREQIKLVRAVGIEPTHLDSHQLLPLFLPGLFQAYLKVGRELGIPVLLSRSVYDFIRPQLGERSPDWDSYLQPDDILIDNILSISPPEAAEGWSSYYRKAIKGLQPGVTQIIVHVATENSEEMMGMTGNESFGASWRYNEFEYLTGEDFGSLLEEENVKLITWREIAKIYNPDSK
jgi:predicted glycoside hydrolase/deacetylase ChbG (UPF0249 family)